MTKKELHYFQEELDLDYLESLQVVEEISFYFARAEPNFVLKPKDKMRKEVASFKMIVNFKL